MGFILLHFARSVKEAKILRAIEAVSRNTFDAKGSILFKRLEYTRVEDLSFEAMKYLFQ